MSLQSLDRVLSKTADRSVGDIVATYGSNVQKLKMDAAAGKIDPTKAVMAMMAIQRIVAANTQPPPGTTVAQDTGIAPPPQPMMPPPAAAPQQAPVQMAYGGQVAVSNNQVPSPAMERGLEGIPVPDNMFDYAEGGMVAFADGGNVQRFQTGKPVRVVGPNEPRLGGFTWDQLPTEDSGLYGPMVRGLYEAFMPASSERKKRDPITGEMLSFSQFLERASQPQVQKVETEKGLSAIDPALKSFGDRLAARRSEMLAPPTANAPNRPPIDPFKNFDPVAAAREKAKQDAAKQKVRSNVAASTDTRGAPTQTRPIVEGMDGQPYASYMDRAESQVRNLMALPKVTTPAEEIERMKQADIAAGVNPKFFEEQALKIEAAKEALKGDRTEAANLRLLEAGLSIMGGSSPFAFVNIGKGASEAMKGFAQDVKDLQKQRKEYDKLQRDLAVAEQTAARTKSAAAYEAVEKKQTAFDAAKNNVAKATIDLAQSYENVDLTKQGLRIKEELGREQIRATREQTAATERARNQSAQDTKEYRREQSQIRYLDSQRREIESATKEIDAQLNKLAEMEVLTGGKLQPEQQRLKTNLLNRKKLIIDDIKANYEPLISGSSEDTSSFKVLGSRPAR